jgi:ABC-type uncharacterized transport system permease subunit
MSLIANAPFLSLSLFPPAHVADTPYDSAAWVFPVGSAPLIVLVIIVAAVLERPVIDVAIDKVGSNPQFSQRATVACRIVVLIVGVFALSGALDRMEGLNEAAAVLPRVQWKISARHVLAPSSPFVINLSV